VRRCRSWPPPRAGGGEVGCETRRRARKVGHGHVQEAGFDEPPEHVAVAEAPRRPRRAARTRGDLAARPAQLLGDLAAGLSAADHEHGSGREVAGRGVARRRRARSPAAAQRPPAGVWCGRCRRRCRPPRSRRAARRQRWRAGIRPAARADQWTLDTLVHRRAQGGRRSAAGARRCRRGA
jgi:hypothetical protein